MGPGRERRSQHEESHFWAREGGGIGRGPRATARFAVALPGFLGSALRRPAATTRAAGSLCRFVPLALRHSRAPDGQQLGLETHPQTLTSGASLASLASLALLRALLLPRRPLTRPPAGHWLKLAPRIVDSIPPPAAHANRQAPKVMSPLPSHFPLHPPFSPQRHGEKAQKRGHATLLCIMPHTSYIIRQAATETECSCALFGAAACGRKP